MIYIICIETEHAENIGSIARVMKNFGFASLVLIRPKELPTDPIAVKVAKHAQDVLKNALVTDESFLEGLDYLVATTSLIGTDYNIPRSPITPEQLAKKVIGKDAKIGILFGREGEGLLNKEILKCDYTVTIPSSKDYPALNLAQSVAVVCYELFKHSNAKKLADHITPISGMEKKVISERLDSLFKRLDFATEKKRETQHKLWTRIIGKAMLTKRESFALLGFLRKVEAKLKP